MHLLAILALYVSVISFLALIFQIINIYFPDPVEEGPYFDPTYYYEAIRWSVAALIVIFPVFIATSWMLNKSYLQTPSKRDLRIRKWLIYFTLFLAAIVIIVDLVTLIYYLLQGGLTARFILKVLTVLATSGAVFGYYYMDLRKFKTE